MFEATAKLKIREGELEGFKQQAAEVMRQMRAQDEQPLRYDWFLSDDGTECEVREAYVDADALLEHQHHIAEAKMKLFRDSVDGHTMTFYAEPSSGTGQGAAGDGGHLPSVLLLPGIGRRHHGPRRSPRIAVAPLATRQHSARSEEAIVGSVRADGRDLYFEQVGKGVPILLIHPAGATASAWAPRPSSLPGSGA
jgi:quinol monooxygenase YgiN